MAHVEDERHLDVLDGSVHRVGPTAHAQLPVVFSHDLGHKGAPTTGGNLASHPELVAP